jgi:hAT family C-terminal dimerisation region
VQAIGKKFSALRADDPVQQTVILHYVFADHRIKRLMDRYIHSADISINPRESLLKFLNFISERDVGFRSLFPELLKLMQILAVIPAWSAPAERSFSALIRVKTCLRSTMSQAKLNRVGLLLLYVHKELSPDIKSVMAEFTGLNDTRRRIFGDMA